MMQHPPIVQLPSHWTSFILLETSNNLFQFGSFVMTNFLSSPIVTEDMKLIICYITHSVPSAHQMTSHQTVRLCQNISSMNHVMVHGHLADYWQTEIVEQLARVKTVENALLAFYWIVKSKYFDHICELLAHRHRRGVWLVVYYTQISPTSPATVQPLSFRSAVHFK